MISKLSLFGGIHYALSSKTSLSHWFVLTQSFPSLSWEGPAKLHPLSGTYFHYLHLKLLCCWVSTMFYPYSWNMKGLYISGKPARLGQRESIKAISKWQQSSLPFRTPKGTDLSWSLSHWILFCLFPFIIIFGVCLSALLDGTALLLVKIASDCLL